MSIVCGSCGRAFTWKPNLAGKRAKCPCGGVVEIPSVPFSAPEPASAPLFSDEVFAGPIGEGPALPLAPVDPMPAPAIEPPNMVMTASGKLIERRSKVSQNKEETEKERDEMAARAHGSVFRVFILPIPIAVGGIILSFLQASQWSDKPITAPGALISLVLMRTIGGVALILLAMFLITKVFDVTFLGSFVRNIPRLCAIALGPAPLYDCFVFWVGGDLAGPFAGVVAMVAAYGLLYFLLMRLDLPDTAVCTIVTWILVTIANYMAWRAEGMKAGSDI